MFTGHSNIRNMFIRTGFIKLKLDHIIRNSGHGVDISTEQPTRCNVFAIYFYKFL
jgi:hypothetical protein